MAVPAPASGFAPRSLAAWLELLELKQLPVNEVVRAKTLKMLSNGASATAMVPVILDDPALVLLLFREANRALARYDREAHTLEHAISLLGVGRAQKLLEKAETLAADHPHVEAYRLVLLRSQHAAAQARMWADGTGLWPGEEVFWSTLLAAAPLWLLQLEAGDAAHRLDVLRAEESAIGKQHALELFGCDPLELSAILAERWLLPQMSRLSWQRSATGTLRQWIALEHSAHLDEAPTIPTRELTELCHHPALIVALANALAIEADWNWYSRRCLRVLSIAATACRRPLSTLITYCHQTAAAISREFADSGLPTPGAKLLGQWNEARLWAKEKPPAPKPAANDAGQPEQATGPSAAERALAANVKKLRTPTEVSGVREALELGMNALHDGVGFHRVAVMFVKPGTRELQTVLSAGAEQAPALRQFRYSVQQSQLFTQLLAKPICLLLDADNRAKYTPHLPDTFRAAIGCDNFALMSVFAGERPVALIYADTAPALLAAGSRQHTLFKQVCQQVSQTLAQLG
ncbi:MAG: hypothetical protein JWM78_3818 [Verrucomicrobiaceae bacterium]|nr:hypothetical protein [Verrucomicrobiaceae bacterium]